MQGRPLAFPNMAGTKEEFVFQFGESIKLTNDYPKGNALSFRSRHTGLQQCVIIYPIR